MVTIHQALYGDKDGSYALLKTSLTDEEHAKRICNVTDVLDRPSSGYINQPIFRGFSFQDTYLLIKSFPEDDPSVRRGRVLSHTLIIEQQDLGNINDIGALFSHLLTEPQKDIDLQPITLDYNTSEANQVVDAESREAVAINSLLTLSDHSNTLIWLYEENYLQFVSKIWPKLNSEIRAKLKLGVGFNPPGNDSQSIKILYVLDEYESKWSSEDYCIVRKGDSGKLESMAALYLGGYIEKSRSLIKFIDTYGLVPTTIEDYGYLENFISTYERLPNITDFNRLVVFCESITKLSQDPSVSKSAKNNILEILLSLIENASSKQIQTLQHLKWGAFENAQVLIGEKISAWYNETVIESKAGRDLLIVINSAI